MRQHRTLRLLGFLAALLICARARIPAFAQFSTPYDPDFPAEKQAEKKPQAAPEEGAAVPVIIMPLAGPFLLLDRADPKHLFEQAPPPPEEKPHEFVEFEEGLKPLQYSQEKYNMARTHIEEGRAPTEEGLIAQITGRPVVVSTAAAPKPPPPEVELPTYGTSLSVTGRKVIGFTYSEKRFLHDQAKTGRPATTNLITIDQQLQLRMQGKVGPKITVNVDYDDTKLNHQDISVVYTGDPNEVVQNVSFGDIDLSLPPTEFVSYNKQLFGIRADIKYKGLKASFIGSRTKGTTKSKQFFGNTQFVATDILDSNYVRRQHYDLAFGVPARLPLKSGSERVFLARQIPGQTNITDQTLTVDDLILQSSTFTGTFSQLNAGVDYTIDYVKGILSLRSQLQPQFVVAVDFVDASGNSITVETSSTTLAAGGTGRFKLVKTPGDLPIECSTCTADEVGHNRELKTSYNIGQNQIVRDNGRGNFILKVLDQQRNETGSALNPVQKYPDTIDVDFENGTFRLQQPFSVSNASPTVPDPDLYSPTPISKRLLHVEYSFRFKTFFLEPNLVPQSEVVLLDNAKLNRNVDYFIDYEAGFVTFFNEERIRSQSEIAISFEVAPFANITNESLLGSRVSYDFTKNFSMGSMLLYQAGAKSPTVPTITELNRSLLVYEFDSKLKDLKLGRKFKMTSFNGEYAQSRQNLNLNPFALIDNMEGIRQEENAPTLSQQWFIASNPGGTGLSGGAPSDPTKLSLLTEDVRVLDINPRAQAGTNETQKVLDLNYNSLSTTGEEVSIVFPFSISGIDVSQKTILEVVMLGDNSLNDINFRLGGIAEDADADGVFDTEDVNLDNILQPGEDIGWFYNPAAGTTRFGANNGRIDTEDLNANSRLDADDGNGNNFGYGLDLTSQDPSNTQFVSIDGTPHPNGVLNFAGGVGGGWQTFQIPLNISSATLNRWTNVKQVRISVKKTAAGIAGPSVVKFARIAVVGNTWQRGQATDPLTNSQPVGLERLVVTPVNNVDNPGYAPIFNAGGEASQVFNDLYGSPSNLQRQSTSKNLSEQALQLTFSSMTIVGGKGAVVTTKRLFTRSIDISQHRFFNFLVFGNAQPGAGTNCTGSANCTDHTFFLRAGNDTNFFEVQVPLDFVGWKKVRVLQADTNKDSIADTWIASTDGTVIVSSGVPSLQQVAELVAGVKRTASTTAGADATQTSGIAYVNEIHLAEPVTRVGSAKKIEANFDLAGWGSFGLKYREVDRNFQTPTSVVSNQDNRQDSAFLNVSRISFFPMAFNLSRAITDTPSTFQTGALSNTVNLLQQGKVTTWTGSASGNFTRGSLPRLSLSHTRNRIEYELLTRLDDRKTYNATLQYGVPINSRFVPKTVDANYGLTRYDVSFASLFARKLPGNFDTNEYTQNLGLRLTFTPWTGSSFNPSYSLTRVAEKRSDFTGNAERNLSYPKSLTQSAGFTSNYRLTSWLNPQANYTIDILENNILSVSTFVVNGSTKVFEVGDIKTVNRSANGSVNLPLTVGEIFKKTRLLRSMSVVSGYQIQDGDVWNNIEKEKNNQLALWVRTPLKPTGAAAIRQTQTLRDTFNSTQRWSPLEAYDIKGRKAAWKTINISNNYVRSIQRSDTTGTLSKTLSTTFPDAVASISQLEQLWHSERWMSNTQMNLKYSAHKTENVGQTLNTDQALGADLRSIIRKRFDTLLSGNLRSSINRDLRIEANTQKTAHQDATVQVTFDVRKFRFTPKTDYTHDTTQLGTGVKTQDLTVITPSLLVRADLAMPKGLRLPGSSKTLLFTNRIIWTTTLSLADRASPVTIADNSRLFSFNTSADYEIAKNLRMTLNGALSRLWHRFLKEEDFISYQFGTTLTFQF